MNLLEKIEKIEALLAGAKTSGERQAASLAKERLLKKKGAVEKEYSIRVDSHWKKKLFVTVCRKHGFQTYRYRGQKHTTTMLRISQQMLDEILWPEFQKYSNLFEELAKEIMDDLIAKIYNGGEEEMVIMGELEGSQG